MKTRIVDVICSAGHAGFFFDDQRAIKAGAGHDGFVYSGAPSRRVPRASAQAGECVSVLLLLDDGQVACGDCAAVQYSGAGGRDPLFLAEDAIPLARRARGARCSWGGSQTSFRGLAAEV